MLLFQNAEKLTYFGVDQYHNKVVYAPARVASWLVHTMQYTNILVLPDLKTITRFRRLIAKGAIHNLPDDQARAKLIDDYPEYFI